MKFLHIVWKNLMRRKIRTIFTLLSIFVAFLLFGYLMAVRTRSAWASSWPARTG
jgi:putative ABC transport system permease protein